MRRGKLSSPRRQMTGQVFDGLRHSFLNADEVASRVDKFATLLGRCVKGIFSRS